MIELNVYQAPLRSPIGFDVRLTGKDKQKWTKQYDSQKGFLEGIFGGIFKPQIVGVLDKVVDIEEARRALQPSLFPHKLTVIEVEVPIDIREYFPDFCTSSNVQRDSANQIYQINIDCLKDITIKSKNEIIENLRKLSTEGVIIKLYNLSKEIKNEWKRYKRQELWHKLMLGISKKPYFEASKMYEVESELFYNPLKNSLETVVKDL